MTELEKGKNYTARMMQAERNVKSRIDDILSDAAVKIATQARSLRFSSNESLYRQAVAVLAKDVLEKAMDSISEYVREYSKASISILGDKDTGATTRLLNSELFGKTFDERNRKYVNYFADDIANILIMCDRLKLKGNKITEAILAAYKSPYESDLMSKSQKAKKGPVSVPSHGRGIYHSAYQNIVRNAQGVISIAWSKERKNKAKRDGSIGFFVHRGSSYPCDICDAEVEAGLHEMDEEAPPYHVNCCCVVEYVYRKEEDDE